MANITLTVGNISNNGVPCKNPVIIVLGTTGDISFPCSRKIGSDGKIKISIPDDLFANKCITLIVRCDECDSCPEKEVTVCLCNDSNDCEACSECQNGICVELCPDKLCVNGSCCDCATTADCPPGFLCDGCNCNCLGKVNSRGECVECLKDSECGPCQLCLNGVCTDIVCPANLICIGGACGCPPGTVFDQTTGVCVPADECTDDSQCAECETCVAGFCQPIICPPNYRCVDGECIYWPCTDVTCNNGADCGVDCGCLNGECVPCYLLDCADIASCPSALGCKCNNLEQCVPVDNCGQYCDGSTPCLEPNCTCYNNRCVDCSNFPCPEDCATHYNCGCNAEGDCEGGAGCNDTIVLLKKENCGTDLGCELVAEYTTTNECGCEPIEVRVNNEKSCTAPTPATGDILSLRVELFKNNRPYQDFRNQISIGDDELVQAVVTTTVLHYVKDNTGQWVLTSVPATAVDNVVAIDNKFDPIPLTNAHIKNTFSGKPTKVVVELRIEGVSIPNNDCIDYDSKVIATYELDYSNYTATCAKINGEFKVIKNTFLNDNESVRRPLFVWSKSTTSTFANTKFVTNGVYTNSGWFRKEYGNLIAGKWTDKLNDPKRFAQDQYNELWNNYNYKVKVDCGCKSNDATLQKVVFCCPKEFDYTTTACGRIITIPPFDTCSVNKKLSTLNSVGYTIPTEAQTFYYVTLNGVDYLMNPAGGPITQNFVKELEVPITSVVFSQRYSGTPLIARACDVEYVEEVVAPDFKLEAECGKLTVTQISGTNAISSVKISGTTQTFTKVTNQNKWELAVPTNSAIFDVAATFQNTCVFVKTIDVFCQPEVEAVPTDLVAKGECPNGGTNPNIALDAIKGFVGVVEFLDPRPGKTWVDGTLSGTTYKVIFTNFAAGTYTFTARQKSNPTITATVTVTINPPIELELTTEAACNQSNGKLILKAAPGSVWNVFGSGFPGTGAQQTIPAGGILNITIPNANAGGSFVVAFVSDLSGRSCGGSQTIVVPKDGGTVMVSITAPATACRGTEIPFTVNDGGAGLQYTLLHQDTVFKDGNGAVITTINGGQSGTATYNGTANQITLNPYLTVAGCFTAFVSPQTVNIKTTPNINSINTCAAGNSGFYLISFTSSLFPLVSPVLTVGNSNYPLTHQGNGLYIHAGIINSLNNQNYSITTTYDGCQIVKEFAFSECNDPNNCPPVGTPIIMAAPQYPCAVSTTVLSYTSGMIFDTGDTYRWVDVSTNSTLSNGPIIGGVIPPQAVTAELYLKVYKLIISKNNGACNYESESIGVQAQQDITVTISGSGIYPNTETVMSGTQYSYSVGPIPGATYNWVLTNPGGASTVNLGNTPTVTGVSFLQGLSNITVTVTVTSTGCTYTDSENVQASVNCSGSALIALVDIGSDNCRDIGAIVSGIAPGDTITEWTWFITNTPSPQTGVALPVLNFDTSVIAAGETKFIRLLIVTANGCSFVSNTLEYERCACLCNGPSCTTLFNTNQGGNDGSNTIIGTFVSGTQLDWGFSPFEVADRFVIKKDGVIILDTGKVTSFSSCGCAESADPANCDCLTDLYLGDEAGNVGVVMTVGTCNVGPAAGINFCLDGITPLLVNPGSMGTLPTLHQMGGTITLLADGEISVEVTGAACGSGGTVWNYAIGCV